MTDVVGADWFDTYAGPATGLPMVGSVFDYVCLDDKATRDQVLSSASQPVRNLIEFEERVNYGVAQGIVSYYETVPKNCRAFCLLARVAVLGAFLTHDMALFRAVCADVNRFQKCWPTQHGRMAVEFFYAWLRQLVFIPDGYPDWLRSFDWTVVPVEWRHQVGYVGIRMLLVQGRFESALSAASVFQLFNRSSENKCIMDMLMMLVCAIACRELGRTADQHKWYRQSVELAMSKRYFIPFISYSLGSGSPLAKLVEEMAPSVFPHIRHHIESFFQSVIFAHNFLTGKHVTTVLSRREFYIAHCLKNGLPYKEIAERSGVSVGRVRNIISDVYGKLHVHKRTRLSSLVW